MRSNTRQARLPGCVVGHLPSTQIATVQQAIIALAMAKNSKKRPRSPPKRVWDPEDVIELLAWVDYCQLHSINFYGTVVNHLKAKTHKSLSRQQINTKLRSEWAQWGRYGNHPVKGRTFRELLTEGSSCLVRYSERDHQNIRGAVDRLGPPPASRYRLRSTSSVLQSRSHTLSHTRQTSETSTLTVLGTPELEDIFTRQSSEVSTLTALATPELEDIFPAEEDQRAGVESRDSKSSIEKVCILVLVMRSARLT